MKNINFLIGTPIFISLLLNIPNHNITKLNSISHISIISNRTVSMKIMNSSSFIKTINDGPTPNYDPSQPMPIIISEEPSGLFDGFKVSDYNGNIHNFETATYKSETHSDHKSLILNYDKQLSKMHDRVNDFYINHAGDPANVNYSKYQMIYYTVDISYTIKINEQYDYKHFKNLQWSSDEWVEMDLSNNSNSNNCLEIHNDWENNTGTYWDHWKARSAYYDSDSGLSQKNKYGTNNHNQIHIGYYWWASTDFYSTHWGTVSDNYDIALSNLKMSFSPHCIWTN